jgi:hypothetical protein
MLTIAEAHRRIELFLTGQMLEALRTVEYELPSFDTEPVDVELADVARSRVEIRHVRGASDATYLINAFGDELLMQLQLNVHRLVVVYGCRRSTRSMPAPWRCGSSGGASAPSMPAGNSAGAIRPLPAIWAAVLSKHIATLSRATIFSKTSRSNSIGAPTLCR